ncbi:MAG TPA: PBP1A family penicillin-binding protein [Longimicrobiales bacterium]|nr:PBP1A family penicillin-binding protein [Longimicrobiales bacterium]
MPITFLPGGGPDPWRTLLRRAAELIRATVEDARDGLAAAGAAARRRWPGARARLLAANDRIDRAVQRGWRRVRPTVHRVAVAVGRHAPSRRQTAVVATVLLVVGWVLWERCGVAGCPDVERLTSYQPGGAPVLVDRTGEVFADLAPVEHQVVPLDSLPPHVAHAFIAVEDRRFYEHRGVDWWRVFGALRADIRAGGLVQGSSTIPMQLSRTLFPDRIRREEKTFRRKLLEVRVAREVEERFSKDEILELYLNHVYFGGGAYGIEAASRHYFGTGARDLDVEEAALLAGLLKAPSHYHPRRHPEAARARRDLVLTLMEREDYLSFREAEAARGRELAVVPDPGRDRGGDVHASYFIRHVRDLLEGELGEDLYAAPLRIMTTLDTEAQRAAEEELARQLRSVERGAYGYLPGSRYDAAASDGTSYLQGAVVIMDSRSGDILAWVGGRDFDHSRYDRARLGRRQAGSAFKPFVYAAALERGYAASQPILDAPYRFAVDRNRVWEPRNYSGDFRGYMSMREALIRSQNVPAARLAAAVGLEHVADFARRAGLNGEVPSSPVAALGVTTVSPLDMTTAYSAFSGLGTRVEPRFVLRVEDEDGEVLWSSEPVRTRVTDPAIAFILTDMLRDVVDRGTGTAVRWNGFRGPAAGKTGTTSDATDVWFVGYTPRVVGTIWIGFDELKPLTSRATGGGIAAPVWGRIMARAFDDPETPHWGDAPADVLALRVDPETGLALESGCYPWRAQARRELFLAGMEPPEVCPRDRRDDWMGRLAGWMGSGFYSRRAPPLRGEPDPHLGAPRLPRRGDPAPVVEERRRADRRGPLGTPIR